MPLGQALAGMLWSKQYFFFNLDKWLEEHGVHSIVLSIVDVDFAKEQIWLVDCLRFLAALPQQYLTLLMHLNALVSLFPATPLADSDGLSIFTVTSRGPYRQNLRVHICS